MFHVKQKLYVISRNVSRETLRKRKSFTQNGVFHVKHFLIPPSFE